MKRLKRLLIFLPLLLLAFTTACDKEDVIFMADTLVIAVDVGLPVWDQAHQNACDNGTATPAQCAEWDELYPKLLTTYDAIKFAYEEVKKTNGKPAKEKLLILLQDAQPIIQRIVALVNAWKPKHVDEILRRLKYRLTPEAMEAVRYCLKS